MQAKLIYDAKDNSFYLKQDNEYIAYITWDFPEENLMDIKSTYVDERYRAQNIGRKLVYKAADLALENNYHLKATCPFANVVLKRADKYKDILV